MSAYVRMRVMVCRKSKRSHKSVSIIPEFIGTLRMSSLTEIK